MEKLRGKHISFHNYDSMTVALKEGRIDAMIVPTYNSLIGEVLPIDCSFVTKGAIDHTIQLSLYSNQSSVRSDGKYHCNRLYVEPHIFKECQSYIFKNIRFCEIVYSEHSKAGCISRHTYVACYFVSWVWHTSTSIKRFN